MSKSMKIGDDFEILLSQNNLVIYLKIKKITIRRYFDDDRDYDHSQLEDWEIHSKIDSMQINDLVNIRGFAYKFYYNTEQQATFTHTLHDEFEIEYESNEFDVYEKYTIKYTKEEFFDVIKPQLIKLL